jgi:hypothetical protein
MVNSASATLRGVSTMVYHEYFSDGKFIVLVRNSYLQYLLSSYPFWCVHKAKLKAGSCTHKQQDPGEHTLTSTDGWRRRWSTRNGWGEANQMPHHRIHTNTISIIPLDGYPFFTPPTHTRRHQKWEGGPNPNPTTGEA